MYAYNCNLFVLFSVFVVNVQEYVNFKEDMTSEQQEYTHQCKVGPVTTSSSSSLTPWWGTVDAEIKGPEPRPRVPLSKPVVGYSIALHAVPAYRASTYLVPAFPAHSTSFSPNFFNPQ